MNGTQYIHIYSPINKKRNHEVTEDCKLLGNKTGRKEICGQVSLARMDQFNDQ